MTLGFRPEDLRISDDGFPVAVELVEILGADAYVYGKVDLLDGTQKDVTIRADGRRPPHIGDTIKVSIVEDHSHVFDSRQRCALRGLTTV